MNKVSRVKNDNFTVISNVFLQDKRLSIKAKGFLAVVMGLPSDWEFTINGVCSIIKEGKTAIYNVIDELKEYGYCCVTTCRDEKGRISGNDYIFYEEPQKDYPRMENPNMDNPNVENQPQLNTYNIKDIFDKEKKEDKSSKKDELFEQCWVEYNRKGSKAKSKVQWEKLSQKEKEKVITHIKAYVSSRELHYQQDFERYLKYKTFNDLVVTKNNVIYDPSNATNDSLFTNNNDNGETTKNETLIIDGVCYR